MTNKEAIEWLERVITLHEVEDMNVTLTDRREYEALNLAIKALEKDKCSSCKHYDKDYGETCLNPEGTCRVFEYDRYEETENE